MRRFTMTMMAPSTRRTKNPWFGVDAYPRSGRTLLLQGPPHERRLPGEIRVTPTTYDLLANKGHTFDPRPHRRQRQGPDAHVVLTGRS